MRGTLVEVNKEQRRRILSTQASLRLHLGRLNPSRAHVSPVTSLFTVSRSHEGSPLPNRNGAMTACRTACRPPSHAQDCSPPPHPTPSSFVICRGWGRSTVIAP